jgi:iron complex outermembrane receptor protein
LASAGQVFAQDSAATPATPATTDQTSQAQSADTLQEVVVTAERRATDVQETPIAVTAMSGDQLATLHLVSLDSLQTTVPGFQNADQGWYNNLNIRGMGSAQVSAATQDGVAVIRDGMLLPEPIGQAEPMFDVADVEVLEGPQGTLVGESSTAGAVEINSVNPNFNGLNGYVEAGFANYTDMKWQGAVNLPISDTLAMRFAFNDEGRGSFSKDIGDTAQGYYYNAGVSEPLLQGPEAAAPSIDPGHEYDRQARLKALWKPSDSFQAVAVVEYSWEDVGIVPGAAEPNPLTYQTLFTAGPGGSGYAGCNNVPGTTFTGNQLVCPLAGAPTHSTYYYPGEQPYVLDYYGQNFIGQNSTTRFGLNLNYTLPGGITVRSNSGYQNIEATIEDNISYGPQNAGTFNPSVPYDHYYTQELDVLSPTGGKVDWLAGASVFYRDTLVLSNQTNVGSPYLPNALPSSLKFGQSDTVNRFEGVFGQLDWKFTNTLQLQVGARENWDNNANPNAAPSVAAAPGTILSAPNGAGTYSLIYPAGSTVPSGYKVVASGVSTAPDFTDTVPTGKIDLNWTPAPGQNFYVFYARGYKSGGVNPGSTDHPHFSPEHVNDYELGWKGRLFDGHMLTQVGAYYYNYQNEQYQLFDTQAQNDTITGNYIANLGAGTIEGFQLAEQARFGGLGINFGGDYNESKLGAAHAVNSSAFPAGFGTPLTLPQCVAGHTYIAPTQCFDYTPYATNTSGEEDPFAPRITANLSVDYSFPLGSGALDPRVTFSHTDKQYASIFENAYNEMGARNLLNASADYIINHWDVQLYGTNLNNETYIISGGNPLYYGAPRQYGVQGTYKF